MVALEIVRLKKKKDAAAGLVSYTGDLFRSRRVRQQESDCSGVRRTNHNPALAGAHIGVFEKRKAKFLREESDGFVIVTDEKS
jgi:hypothetical protein